MFKMVKKAVGMKPVGPNNTPPSAPVSLPSSPSRAPSKQLSTGESLSVPPQQENTLDLASPVIAAQHTQNRISLISPFDDNHAAMSSPMEYHAGHDESAAETSEYPIYDSPASFNTMDERMLRQMREREDQEAGRQHADLPAPLEAVSAAAVAVLSPVVEEPSSSNSSPRVTYSPALPVTPPSGNGLLRPEAHAVLKGSPRVLGWQVDEESEEKAWEFIMKDAVDSSVFDQPTDEEETHHFLPHSKEELYRMWLKHWDEVNTSLVWRVVPSLKGIHQWILQPEILGEGSVLSTGVDMSTDTDDLPCHIHADAEVQTANKSYTDVGVQTYEVEVPPGALMLLPEKPLKAPTQDFDLAQTVAPSNSPPTNSPPSNSPPTTSPPNERAESIKSETRSRSRSPFRRMIPSRKGSMASITSQAEPEPKPKRSQSPATDTLKRLTSMRSLARGGAPSRNASSASVNVVADASAQARTQSGPIPSATQEEPATATTTPERPPIQSSPSQPAAGRWGAIRRANFALGWR